MIKRLKVWAVVVSMLALYSDDPNTIPVDVYKGDCQFLDRLIDNNVSLTRTKALKLISRSALTLSADNSSRVGTKIKKDVKKFRTFSPNTNKDSESEVFEVKSKQSISSFTINGRMTY